MPIVHCPQCREEMEVDVVVEPSDPSVGWFHEQYELIAEWTNCECELTDKEQSIICQNIINGVQEGIGEDMAERYARGYDDL